MAARVAPLSRLLSRLLGRGVLPADFPATLDAEEHVLAAAALSDGGHVVATSLGLWLPEGRHVVRVGWHLVSKATWANGTLSIVVADETGRAGEAVLLADRPPRRLRLAKAGKLPEVVHQRVIGSIRSRHHHELPGGGAWFVQRKVPGQDGVVLQVRPDPGTDAETLGRVAGEVAARLRLARPPS